MVNNGVQLQYSIDLYADRSEEDWRNDSRWYAIWREDTKLSMWLGKVKNMSPNGAMRLKAEALGLRHDSSKIK